MTSLARPTDPATSHEAGQKTQRHLNATQERVLSVVNSINHMTAQEIAQRTADMYGGLTDTYRKRIHELVSMQSLERRGVRKCSITGNNATVYARPRPQ